MIFVNRSSLFLPKFLVLESFIRRKNTSAHRDIATTSHVPGSRASIALECDIAFGRRPQTNLACANPNMTKVGSCFTEMTYFFHDRCPLSLDNEIKDVAV